jgi:hypothetical protein
VKRWPPRSRAARSVAEWWEGKSGVGDGFNSDVWSSDKGGQPTWGGDDRRPPVPSALCAVITATGNRVARGTE